MALGKKTFRARVFGMDFNESIWAVQEWNLDIRNFSLYLTGEPIAYSDDEDADRSEPGVEYQMSTRLIKNLQILSEIDRERVILLHMKTDGGDWMEGMAIYDAIRLVPNRVVILNYTHARSMSSIMFQAADRRIMMPHSHFMFHEGSLAVGGTVKGTISTIEWSKRDTLDMINIYVDRMKERGKFCRRSQESIREMLQMQMDKKEDVYLTARETIEWGLADGIFDGDWEGLRKRISKKKPIIKT